MQKLAFIFIILVVCDYGLSQKLRFSFKSMNDGYIFPDWTTEKEQSGLTHDSSVVVRSKSITLGEGLRVSKGYSCLFTQYLTLRLSDFLQRFDTRIEDIKDFYGRVSVNLKEITDNIKPIMGFDGVKSTMVYMYIQDQGLLTGVIGDSGYGVFRYIPAKKSISLHFLSEQYYEYNDRPEFIDVNRITLLTKAVHKLEEGDIMLVISSEVMNLLSYPFLVVATNQLVFKMITAFNNKDDKFDENSFDLADLVESYLNTLHKLSVKFLKRFVETTKDEVLSYYKNLEIEKETDTFAVIRELITSSSTKSSEEYKNAISRLQISYKKEPELDSSQINSILDDIYKNEICNDFNPYSDNEDDIKNRLNKQCSGTASSPKKTSRENPIKFSCDNLYDLTLLNEKSKKDSLRVSDCVLKVIKKLPDDTTTDKIQQSFKPDYFSRNLSLAANLISKDKRTLMHHTHMKELEKSLKNSHYHQIPDPKINFYSLVKSKERYRDFSAASAVLINEEKFKDRFMTEDQEENNTRNSRLMEETIYNLMNKLAKPIKSEKDII